MMSPIRQIDKPVTILATIVVARPACVSDTMSRVPHFELPRLTALLRTLVIKSSLLSWTIVVLGLSMALCAGATDIDFSHEVVPILREHCASCHGDDEAKGGFSINSRESFLESEAATPGEATNSLFLELVNSTDADVRMPPSDKPRVSAKDRETLARWVNARMPWQDGFSFAKKSYEPPLKPRRIQLPPAVEGRNHPIDRVIDNYCLDRTISRPEPVDDATFVRRASLDLIGLMPDPELVTRFTKDKRPEKHARLIEELLSRDLAYAEHWMTFYNDLFRNDYDGTGFITGGRKQISKWLHQSLVANKPFDQMASELIAPENANSRGFIDGIKWRGDVSAGQTVEIQFAQSVAQSFLGINMKCASCHDSFIDRWKLADAYGLAAVYAERPLELHRCDKPTGKTATATWLFPELGAIDANAKRDERLKQLASLMTQKANGRFARTIVNRLWNQLLGRGIVHPLDAMHTEPWSEDLLDLLANEFVESGHDLRDLLRLIATSNAYRARTEVISDQDVSSAAYVYRGPRAKRMTAEQFVDAVWQLTGSAPLTFDAPVIRFSKSNDKDGAHSNGPDEFAGKWIWGDSAAEGKIPLGGETIVLRRSFDLPSSPIRGAAVVSADNAFRLYVGGREIASGDNWKQPQIVPLQGLLKSGMNHITVVATNGATQPNPAGLYLECRLAFESGESRIYRTNETWRFTSNAPARAKEGRLGKVVGPFKPVTLVSNQATYKTAFSDTLARRLSAAVSSEMPMVRASLMKADFLMRTLGRPNRDQIVTSRPNELTMLEAIELYNGEALAKLLMVGAERWKRSGHESPEHLIDALFNQALSRSPTSGEHKTLTELLGESTDPSAIEDALWSIVMMPEFFIVR